MAATAPTAGACRAPPRRRWASAAAGHGCRCKSIKWRLAAARLQAAAGQAAKQVAQQRAPAAGAHGSGGDSGSQLQAMVWKCRPGKQCCGSSLARSCRAQVAAAASPKIAYRVLASQMAAQQRPSPISPPIQSLNMPWLLRQYWAGGYCLHWGRLGMAAVICCT